MSIAMKMWLWFGAVWFGGRLLDSLVPPANPEFNGALAIAAAMICAAEHFDKKLSPHVGSPQEQQP